MAKNDMVLIDAVIEERSKEALPSSDSAEVFEYFALEQFLKDFDLAPSQIEFGWVDGRGDGGIDGFYVFVNGHLLQDALDFYLPRRNARIDVYVMTCKHHATFQQATVDSMLASLPELLDFSLDWSQLKGSYSDELHKARNIFYAAFRRLSIALPILAFHFAYISRGDSAIVGESVRARASQVNSLMGTLFSHCTADFHFVGASELISLYRRTKTFSLELQFLECLTKDPNCYVALARLDEYCHFVTDADGSLRRYLFDSNVRDYLGRNLVNEDISDSLKDADAPDFWWLNNGVTLLATAATVVGRVIQLHDIQIVNGLQTTECIFRHFEHGNTTAGSRALLVKIIISSDVQVRDKVIRATNSQSAVELASLRATDNVQRNIEDVLRRRDWYYERRTNYYRNVGKPYARFVTPMFLAAGNVALVMKNPALAARLTPRFMKNTNNYSLVFSDNIPLDVWVVITEVLKRVEEGLNELRPMDPFGSHRFVYRWRNLIALLTVSKIMGRFSYGIADLAALDAALITSSLVREIWKVVQPLRGEMSKEDRKYLFVENCCLAVQTLYGVQNPDVVGRQKFDPPRDAQMIQLEKLGPRRRRLALPPEALIQDVERLLPPQPWKPGVHRLVAKQLGCMTKQAYIATQMLINRGVRFRQADGIVYDPLGRIIAIDPERVKQKVNIMPTPQADPRRLTPPIHKK
jgi:AIPR protein